MVPGYLLEDVFDPTGAGDCFAGGLAGHLARGDQPVVKFAELRQAVADATAYCKAQGLFRLPGAPDPIFTDTLELDLGDVEPSLAGPRRPQDRVTLTNSKREFRRELAKEELRPGVRA